MSEWKSIEKDGMPREGGLYLIRHEKYFPYGNLKAIFNPSDGCYFLLDHGGSLPLMFPSSLPIVATHWMRIPE